MPPASQSEIRLGKLTQNTFLSMWSYQNLYYEKGKELCDVLVVFGDYVVIMSDKLIAFDNEVDRDVAWRRWYKKAISSSIKQLRGALKTIQRFPDRIFSNAQASDPFPLRLPANDKMRVFLVAVANGCEKAGSRYNEGPALFINTLCKKDELPFSVGTNFPEFVHIVNHSVVDALFKCFDTTRDFIEYLERKEQELIRETRCSTLNELKTRPRLP